MTSVIEALVRDNETLKAEIATLSESLGEFSERIGEAQWTLMGSGTGEWTLSDLTRVALPLSDMVHSNVLLQRAVDLRHAYVYSDGVKLQKTHRATKAMNDEGNRNAFFSSQAAYTRMAERAATGNLFYLVNTRTNQIVHVPTLQINAIITDDMDSAKIKFVRRRWDSGTGNSKEAWFRVAAHTKGKVKLPENAKGTLNSSWVIVHRAYNRPAGSALGIPDAMAAMKWAEAYAEYLTNQSRLVRAYSRIAGKVARKSQNTHKDVAAQIRGAQDSNTYGAVAVGDFTHLPATGSQVSFDNGRPMAALVAAGLGIGVDALLSGTVGATKSVSDMLDLATNAAMKALQKDEEDLIRAILSHVGAPNAEVDFPTMDHDPMYRRLQGVAQGVAQGLLWREEARGLLLDWYSIPEPKAGLPEPDGFNSWTDPDDPDADPVDPTPRQGHSGAVGTGIGSNHDARDNGEYDT